MTRIIRAVTLALAIWTCAGLAGAQDTAATFEQLQSVVTPGDTVTVTDAQGRDVRGRITLLSPASLAIDVDGTAREWRAGDVRLVRHRQRDSLVDGALIGLAAGAGTGLLIGAHVAVLTANIDDRRGEYTGALLVGAIGAAIGLGIDAARRDDVVVFRAGGATTASLRVMPLVMPRAQGIRAVVVF